MDPSRWKREPSKVHAALRELPDGSIMTTREARIYIPERFIEKQLASIGAETYITGIYALVVEDAYYGVSTINAKMRIQPTTISTVRFGEDSYLEFYFAPGSIVIADTNLIRIDGLVYLIFDEIVAKGHPPWYLEYEDLAKLFETADNHAGVKLGGSHAILEMIAAACARDPKDRSRYYRHSVQTYEEAKANPPAVIPLRSVTYGATNTTAKLLGSYFADGLDSALVNPTTKKERIEDLLRR